MTNNKNNNSYSYKKSYKSDKNVKIYDFSEKRKHLCLIEGARILKTSYKSAQKSKLYDVYKINLLKIFFAFIFIVRKLQSGCGFQGVLSLKN